MSKLENLHAFLSDYRDRPFATGVNDCALFVSDWVKVLTAHDFAAPFRGQYTTDLGSTRLIKKQGFADLADLVAKTLDEYGQRLSVPTKAQRGDIAWLTHHGRSLCGIIAGAGIMVIGDHGLVSLPIASVCIAWRVEGVI